MRKRLLIIGGAVLVVLGIVVAVLGMTYFKNRGELQVKIDVKEAVMPIAYKVYGNPEVENGKYYLSKTIFYNSGKGSVKNLKVSYRVPGYIEWTTPYRYGEVLPGQTVVSLFYPKFPRKILEVLNATPASVEIKYTFNDGVHEHEMIKRKNFQIRGRNELVYTDIPPEEISEISDLFTNINLVACFVTPEDPVIKYFTQQLQKNVLQGTDAGVGGGPNEIVRFMQALYEFEKAAGLVYGGTLGLPEKLGNKITTVQHIRLPREVITGGAGLCIELSTLFCSVAASAGLQPVIFVTQNHAFPGIIVGNDIIAIEATGVGGQGLGGSMSFEQALKVGMERKNRFLQGQPINGAMPVQLLNINQLHAQGYRPPDLQDDASLRKKIDKIFEKLQATPAGWQGGVEQTQPTPVSPQPVSPTGANQYADPSGLFSFAYPSSWELVPSPIPNLPYLKIIAGDPSMTYEAEFYTFSDTYNPDQAMQRLYTILTRNLGEQITYSPLPPVQINGKLYKRYSGVTQSQGMSLYWVAYFTQTSRGVVGFVLGSYTNNLNVPQLKLIKQSFKVAQ